MNLLCSMAKLSNLELITHHQQHLGYLLFASVILESGTNVINTFLSVIS